MRGVDHAVYDCEACRQVSLHNLVTFKEITTFQRPPPAATAVAFHPQARHDHVRITQEGVSSDNQLCMKRSLTA